MHGDGLAELFFDSNMPHGAQTNSTHRMLGDTRV